MITSSTARLAPGSAWISATTPSASARSTFSIFIASTTPNGTPRWPGESGREILIVQDPGPTTGACPIYADRFNMAERKPVSEERIDI